MRAIPRKGVMSVATLYSKGGRYDGGFLVNDVTHRFKKKQTMIGWVGVRLGPLLSMEMVTDMTFSVEWP